MYEMLLGCLVSMFDGEIHKIGKADYIIGREGPSNGLIINEAIVSRNHALIRWREGAYYLHDNNSSNGTFVNGQKINPEEEYQLAHLDEIEFSKCKYMFKIIGEDSWSKPFGQIELSMDLTKEKRQIAVQMPKASLSNYQLKMMEYNKIRGLIVPQVIEEGDRISLYYHTEGLEMLQTAVLKETIEHQEKMEIFLSAVACLQRMGKYLLDMNNLCIQPETLVYHKEERQLKLMYVPYAGEPPFSWQDQIKSVAKLMIPEEEDVREMLENNDITINQIINFLRERKSEKVKKDADIIVSQPKIEISKNEPIKRLLKVNLKFNNPLHIQIPVVLLLFVVYMTNALKPIDFAGFFAITVVVDFWIIRTMKNNKGTT